MFPAESVEVSITFVIGFIIKMNRAARPKYHDRQTGKKKKNRERNTGKKKSWQNKLVQR